MLLLSLSYPQYGTDMPEPVTLASMTDRYRPLLVFAPSDKDPRLLTQVRLFAHDSYELHQRQVLLVPLSLRKRASSWGVVISGADQGEMTPVAMADARRHFRIALADFTVILVGKDGGEKLRSHQPIPYERLRDTIDSMPMRQQEMKQARQR